MPAEDFRLPGYLRLLGLLRSSGSVRLDHARRVGGVTLNDVYMLRAYGLVVYEGGVVRLTDAGRRALETACSSLCGCISSTQSTGLLAVALEVGGDPVMKSVIVALSRGPLSTRGTLLAAKTGWTAGLRAIRRLVELGVVMRYKWNCGTPRYPRQCVMNALTPLGKAIAAVLQGEEALPDNGNAGLARAAEG